MEGFVSSSGKGEYDESPLPADEVTLNNYQGSNGIDASPNKMEFSNSKMKFA
jgi:hypothetical protein